MKVFNFNKSLTIYLGVNKDGSISMHTVEPTRDEARGIWVSKTPFCNSLAYNQFTSLLEKSNITWNNDPEPLTFNI